MGPDLCRLALLFAWGVPVGAGRPGSEERVHCRARGAHPRRPGNAGPDVSLRRRRVKARNTELPPWGLALARLSSRHRMLPAGRTSGAYDLAQRHYEVNLQLFTTRMNLFLLSRSALIAVVTGATGTGKTGLCVNRPAL